jgi:hypothetical protein
MIQCPNFRDDKVPEAHRGNFPKTLSVITDKYVFWLVRQTRSSVWKNYLYRR